MSRAPSLLPVTTPTNVVLDEVSSFVTASGPVLSLDIGSGTQDTLLALPGQTPENWPHFVLPSPAVTIATLLAAHTAARRPVWLYGLNMGGGFGGAVRRHVAAGLAMAASSTAAAALHDNPEQVRALGITLTETCPKGYTAVHLADYEPGFWQTFLAAAGLPAPSLVVAAVQDHGVHPPTREALPVGNRAGRCVLWKNLLEQTHGKAEDWVFAVPPAPCTRLTALHSATGGPVADTSAAAVLGALSTPEVRERSQRQGVTIVNVGNSHTVAFLLFKERIYGIYEQHTGLRTLPELLHDLKEFRFGWLPEEVVRSQGGHGTAFLKQNTSESLFPERNDHNAPVPESLPPEAEGFIPTFITGPRRELLRGHGQFIAPHGDMMLAGAHGLLFALARRA